MDIQDTRIRIEPAPEASDEVRDMFDLAPTLWPEPKRHVARSARRSPYLTAAEELAQPTATPSVKRRSPYAEDPRPVVAATSLQAKATGRSPYQVEAAAKSVDHAGVAINLAASQLSLADRLELSRLRGSEAVRRIIWLPKDAVVTLEPGREFGELRGQSLTQSSLETLAFSLHDLRLRLRHLPWRRAAKPLSLYAVVFVGVFVLFNAQGLYNDLSFRLSPPKVGSTQTAAAVTSQASVQAKAAPTGDFQIQIPKLGQSAPIVLSQSRDDTVMQKDLERGVAHYSGTALPGEAGNVALTGHSSYYLWDRHPYNYVFEHLNSLEVGDTITIYYGGRSYTYRVNGKKIVNPNQVEVLAATPTNTLSLITCWPVFTSQNRLVVTADQIDPVQPGGTPGGAGHLPEI